MNDEIRKVIIDTHNELRNKVAKGDQPTQNPAQNMRKLYWSEALEKEAQDWADTCQFRHDPLLRESRHGQNIYWVHSSYEKINMTAYLMEGVIEWYNEVDLGYNGTFNPETGHYSQLIWGATKLVGCGVAVTKTGRYTDIYLVCNYTPGGNVVGKLPYEYGTVDCENNEMFSSTDYSHLCDINREMLLSCQKQQKELVKANNHL
ncbi:venom allergen 5-like isoform X2 [Cimex lectularius]|nr:venom allergen 5-like isoform X2 [Cimex lectularius]